MSSLLSPDLNPVRTARLRRQKLNLRDKRANRTLRYLALGAGGLLLIALVAVVIRLITGASMAFDKYGISFIGHSQWVPSLSRFGAWPFIFGSLVTSFLGTIGAAITGISIGLFLALLAPRRVAMVVGPLIEMLAALPSIIIGLIGIFLIAPFVRSDIEPWLHSILGWTGLFGDPEPVGNSLFTASLVLVIMVVPIIAALTRDTFLTVSRELRDGAEALGATRWEMIRGVVLPTTMSGIVAACVLGFARAIEEAIAVTQVVGSVPTVQADLFHTGNTMAAVIAAEYAEPQNALHLSSLYFMAVLLLVIGIITNLLARRIALRADQERDGNSFRRRLRGPGGLGGVPALADVGFSTEPRDDE